MSEQERLLQKLKLKAQNACARAEIEVKLRRAVLRRYTGRDEELHPAERCLYWREASNKFHTIQWRGPAVVVAVQRNADTGTVDVYWLAHGTTLLHAGHQHVRRLVDDEGRVDGQARALDALDQLRQRRVVRLVDLRRLNKRALDELDPDDDSFLDPSLADRSPQRPRLSVAPPLPASPPCHPRLLPPQLLQRRCIQTRCCCLTSWGSRVTLGRPIHQTLGQ